MISKQELIDFEKDIAERYGRGEIPFAVHLRSGNEDELIEIFRKYYKKGDYVFNYWASHLQTLLAGVPKEVLLEKILKGHSIAVCLSNFNIYSSGIAASLCGTAVGVAWALKEAGSNNKVLHFCGDMSAQIGVFRDSVEYAYNHDLPIIFIVEDNGYSVTTKTKDVWNHDDKPWFQNTRFARKVIHYEYQNYYSHSGLKKTVEF